jgi:phosphoribosylanthranilate isomerase
MKKQNLMFCTLTGVDESTNTFNLVDLAKKYSFAEFGILYSPSQAGKPGRYPSVERILNILNTVNPVVNFAVHFCGTGVDGLLNSSDQDAMDVFYALKKRGGRVQLNFNLARKPFDLNKLSDFIRLNGDLMVITQQNMANNDLLVTFKNKKCSNHAVLFDESGGNGKSPDFWPDYMVGNLCGYAGGLSTDNLQENLVKISEKVGDYKTWVDMEGSVRTVDLAGTDWFDLKKVESCLGVVDEHLKG